MMAAASVKEVGVKVSETNISTTSAWRHRKSNREAEAKSIKKKLYSQSNLMVPSFLFSA